MKRRLILLLALGSAWGCSGGIPPVSSPTPVRPVAIQDPSGRYTPLLDPALKRSPPEHSLIGKEPLQIEYDGSRGPIVFYVLHYVAADGTVHPTVPTRFEHPEPQIYRSLPKILSSEVQNGQPGFLEIYAHSSRPGSRPFALAMIPIRLELP